MRGVQVVGVCGGGFELLQKEYSCEVAMLHVPYVPGERPTEQMRQYVAKQLREDIVPTLERPCASMIWYASDLFPGVTLAATSAPKLNVLFPPAASPCVPSS